MPQKPWMKFWKNAPRTCDVGQSEIPADAIREALFCAEEIGSGSYGVVFKANLWGVDVAIKKLNEHNTSETFSSAFAEIKMLR